MNAVCSLKIKTNNMVSIVPEGVYTYITRDEWAVANENIKISFYFKSVRQIYLYSQITVNSEFIARL